MKKFLSLIILGTVLITPTLAFAQGIDTTDQDQDGVFDSNDNCISTPNEDQADSDGNEIGDACDNATQDEDGDGIPNGTDNCPEVRNKQYDGDDNGTGIACDPEEKELFLNELSDKSDTALENDQHQLIFNTTIKNFGACTETTRAELCTNDEENEPSNNSVMDKLYQGLLNNRLTTILEEPIGNENIYQRARICETKFLRDGNGLIQFRNNNNGSGFSIDFGIIANAEDLQRIKNDYLTSLTSDEEAIITLGKCEEYFVEKCTPAETETNNRFAKLGDPLPVKVYCDRVQILFSNSGSDLIKNYVGLIYRWASGFVGIVAVLVIIVNGIRISTAGGDQSAVEGARDSIIKSLTSIAILFLAGILLYSINPNFFTSSDLQEPTPNPTTETPEEPQPSES